MRLLRSGFFWTAVGVVATVIGTIVAILQFLYPSPNPPPTRTIVESTSTTEQEDIGIIDADVEKVVHPNYLFGFIRISTDYFYRVDVTTRNRTHIQYKACSAEAPFVAARTAHSGGALFLGGDDPSFDDKATTYFAIPAQPTYLFRFSSFPDSVDPGKLAWMKVRIQCTEPNVQISQWHKVDVEHDVGD